MLFRGGIFVIAATMFFTACSPAEKHEAAQTADSTATADSAKPADIAVAVMKDIPAPSALPAMLEATGVSFDKALPNKPAKAASYGKVSSTAAINLGIYTTDAGYYNMYNHHDDAAASLNAAAKLGESLNVGPAFGTILKSRLEKNLNNQDSLKTLSDDGVKMAYKFLNENERSSTGALVGAGIFTEGLYISTSLVDKYPHDLSKENRNMILSSLVRTITEQEKTLNDMIALLESVPQDDAIKSVLTKFKSLKTDFEALDVEEKIKSNKGDLVLNDATLKAIASKTAEIRAEFVK